MEILIAILGSGVLSTIISGIFALVSQSNARKAKNKDGVSKGVRQLLYDKIKYLGKKHIAAGEITAEDLEDIIAMHETYHNDLNGNGYLDSLMAQVKRLPIKSN